MRSMFCKCGVIYLVILFTNAIVLAKSKESPIERYTNFLVQNYNKNRNIKNWLTEIKLNMNQTDYSAYEALVAKSNLSEFSELIEVERGHKYHFAKDKNILEFVGQGTFLYNGYSIEIDNKKTAEEKIKYLGRVVVYKKTASIFDLLLSSARAEEAGNMDSLISSLTKLINDKQNWVDTAFSSSTEDRDKITNLTDYLKELTAGFDGNTLVAAHLDCNLQPPGGNASGIGPAGYSNFSKGAKLTLKYNDGSSEELGYRVYYEKQYGGLGLKTAVLDGADFKSIDTAAPVPYSTFVANTLAQNKKSLAASKRSATDKINSWIEQCCFKLNASYEPLPVNCLDAAQIKLKDKKQLPALSSGHSV